MDLTQTRSFVQMITKLIGDRIIKLVERQFIINGTNYKIFVASYVKIRNVENFFYSYECKLSGDFFYNNEKLDFNRTFEDYNINSNDVIEVREYDPDKNASFITKIIRSLIH